HLLRSLYPLFPTRRSSDLVLLPPESGWPAAKELGITTRIKLRRQGLREFAWGRGNRLREDKHRGGREEARYAVVWRRPSRSFRSIPKQWPKNSRSIPANPP